jgi:hypothetical protein
LEGNLIDPITAAALKKKRIALGLGALMIISSAVAFFLIFLYAVDDGYLSICGRIGCDKIYRSSNELYFRALLAIYVIFSLFWMIFGLVAIAQSMSIDPKKRLTDIEAVPPSNNASKPTPSRRGLT